MLRTIPEHITTKNPDLNAVVRLHWTDNLDTSYSTVTDVSASRFSASISSTPVTDDTALQAIQVFNRATAAGATSYHTFPNLFLNFTEVPFHLIATRAPYQLLLPAELLTEPDTSSAAQMAGITWWGGASGLEAWLRQTVAEYTQAIQILQAKEDAMPAGSTFPPSVAGPEGRRPWVYLGRIFHDLTITGTPEQLLSDSKMIEFAKLAPDYWLLNKDGNVAAGSADIVDFVNLTKSSAMVHFLIRFHADQLARSNVFSFTDEPGSYKGKRDIQYARAFRDLVATLLFQPALYALHNLKTLLQLTEINNIIKLRTSESDFADLMSEIDSVSKPMHPWWAAYADFVQHTSARTRIADSTESAFIDPMIWDRYFDYDSGSQRIVFENTSAADAIDRLFDDARLLARSLKLCLTLMQEGAGYDTFSNALGFRSPSPGRRKVPLVSEEVRINYTDGVFTTESGDVLDFLTSWNLPVDAYGHANAQAKWPRHRSVGDEFMYSAPTPIAQKWGGQAYEVSGSATAIEAVDTSGESGSVRGARRMLMVAPAMPSMLDSTSYRGVRSQYGVHLQKDWYGVPDADTYGEELSDLARCLNMTVTALTAALNSSDRRVKGLIRRVVDNNGGNWKLKGPIFYSQTMADMANHHRLWARTGPACHGLPHFVKIGTVYENYAPAVYFDRNLEVPKPTRSTDEVVSSTLPLFMIG